MPADKTKITAVSNPQVKYTRRLHRRRVREKEGRCLLEGVRLVADAATAGASFILAFWEETLLGTPGGQGLLDQLRSRPPLGGLHQVHAQVMAELADTETPQGIVVVAQRPAPDPRRLLDAPLLPSGGQPPPAGGASPGPEGYPPPAGGASPAPETRTAGRGVARGGPTIVVLDNVRDPGNVGTVIRSADASGAAGVLYLPGTADPYGSKALRASMGSAFHLPVIAAEQAVLAYRDEGEAGDRRGGAASASHGLQPVDDEDAVPASRSALAALLPRVLLRQGFRLFVADAAAGVPHWRADLGGKAALVLGGEAEGPDYVLWAGAARVAIPMLGTAESLNVAMAASILLYEAARKREGWGA